MSDSSDWLTEGETKFRSLDAGVAGVWAVKVEMNVVYRDGPSSPWVPVPGGKMRQVSVGGEAVWATNPADEVFLRVVSKAEPRGKEWTKIDGSMAMVSVGPSGVCWAVDKMNTVWRRLGAKTSNPIGSKWQSVTGRLSHISVGQAGVWAISPRNEVMYRDQTYDLAGEGEGTGWTKVDGMMVWLSSGENIVWAVSADGSLWYRAGIDGNCPMGTNWFRVDTQNDK